MSWISSWLNKKSGGKIPEIDLLNHPLIGPFVRPFADGITRDAIAKAAKTLEDDQLLAFYAGFGAEIKRRGI